MTQSKAFVRGVYPSDRNHRFSDASTGIVATKESFLIESMGDVAGPQPKRDQPKTGWERPELND